MHDMRETLAQLRAVMPKRERGLIGYEAMANWFDEMGWLTREGRPPTGRP